MALFNTEDTSINNVLNHGSSIKGNIKITGFIRIDGDIDGDIDCSGSIVIGEHARIKGNINARSVIITGGIVYGDIFAPESIQLFPLSVLLGDVQTHAFRADEKSVFHGHCISLKDEASYDEAVQRWRNTTAIVSKAFRA